MRSFFSDPYVYDQVVRAINYVLEQFRPPGDPEPSEAARIQTPYLPDHALERLGEGFAQSLLATKQQRNPIMLRNEIADAIWKRLDEATLASADLSP